MIRSLNDWTLEIYGEVRSDDHVRLRHCETDAGSACDVHASQG